MRLIPLLMAGVTGLALAAGPGLAAPPRDRVPEYPVKAAFLYHFVEFVEWPIASPLPTASVTIGVLGRDPFGDVLDQAILDKVVAGRTLVIRRFSRIEDLEACEILFISSSEMARLPEILARLGSSSVLTVGEADRFAKRGGMIGFFFEHDRVRLEVNRSAAERAGLRVSSKLLAVARLVKTDAENGGDALMGFTRDLPLRHKLTLLVTLTTGLVLGLAALVLAAYDLRRGYKDLQADLGSLAHVIGSNSTGALTFNDPGAADEILSALSAQSHIVSARLFDGKGQPFATYRRRGMEAEVVPERARADSYHAGTSEAVLFQGVKLGRETAGTLYLKSDLGKVRGHFEGYMVVIGLVMLGSVIAASIISSRWQSLVSDPILRLADAASAVAASKDYSTRVASSGGDEVGVLTVAFNEMLSQIERRDAELRLEVKERHHAEEQLRQGQKMEAVGRLAGGVAHDFNNLLGVILGYSEMLLAKDLAPSHQRKVEQIQKAGERAAALTRQLLAFSRKQVLTPKVLDLNALVVDLARMLPRVLGEDIELVIAEGPGLGKVKADPGQLEQVLMNLSVNARDAMPQGGRITIATSNATLDQERGVGEGAAGSSFVMLAVSDTGIGMDAETRSHAFEPFFTTKEQGKGTGLGLATVYGIMKQSDGHIAIETTPGQGTTFRLYFPRVDSPVTERAVLIPEPSRHGRETILLVEDEGALRELVASMLRERGHTVLEADSGAAAVAIAERHAGVIHLLLSDVIMPGMNGRQAAREVALRRPAIKVAYMSGYSDEALGARGILDPGCTLLTKPFTGQALDGCLMQVLGAPMNPSLLERTAIRH